MRSWDLGEIAVAADLGIRAAPPPARIMEVVRYVERHYAEPCSLRNLAVMAGLSRFHFLRLFRAATGVSPHQYIIALRLRAAAERLRSTAEPVTFIALDVGFNDLSHFNLLFRRSFGAAPREWRTRC
jgi:AraC family transcriptional regulator